MRLFILKENLGIIVKNFTRFMGFEGTFVLIKENYHDVNGVKTIDDVLVTKIQNAIQHQIHLQSILSV